MASRRKKISRLGALAVIAGGVAWAATRAPVLGEGPVVIGTLGAFLAMLALVGSLLLGNTGRLLPLLGLAACASAAAYGVVVNGHAPGIADQFSHLMSRFHSNPPAAAPVQPPAVIPPPTKQEIDKTVGAGSIFDMSPGASHPTPAPQAPVLNAPQTEPSEAPIAPPPAPPNPAQLLAAATAEVARAHAKVDSAMAGMLPALSQTPDYQSAKAELDAADAALKAARANGDPGNAELVAASQRYLDAKTALSKIVSQAAATDPNVVAARRELIEAEGNLQATRAQQSAPANSNGPRH